MKLNIKKIAIIVLVIVLALSIGYMIFNIIFNGNKIKIVDGIAATFDRIYNEEVVANSKNHIEIVCTDITDKIISSTNYREDGSSGIILTINNKVYAYNVNEKYENGQNCMLIDTRGSIFTHMVGTDLFTDDYKVSGTYNEQYGFSNGPTQENDGRLKVVKSFNNKCLFGLTDDVLVSNFVCENKVYDYQNYETPIFTIPSEETVLNITDFLIRTNKSVYIKSYSNYEKCSVNLDIKCEYQFEKNDKLTEMNNYISFYSNSILQDVDGKIFAHVFDAQTE